MLANMPKFNKRKLLQNEKMAYARRHKYIKLDNNISVSRNELELLSKSGSVIDASRDVRSDTSTSGNINCRHRKGAINTKTLQPAPPVITTRGILQPSALNTNVSTNIIKPKACRNLQPNIDIISNTSLDLPVFPNVINTTPNN